MMEEIFNCSEPMIQPKVQKIKTCSICRNYTFWIKLATQPQHKMKRASWTWALREALELWVELYLKILYLTRHLVQ